MDWQPSLFLVVGRSGQQASQLLDVWQLSVVSSTPCAVSDPWPREMGFSSSLALVGQLSFFLVLMLTH